MRGTDIGRLCREKGWTRPRLIHEMRRAHELRRGVDPSLPATLPSEENLKRQIRQWISGEHGLSDLYAPTFSMVFGVPFEAVDNNGFAPVVDGTPVVAPELGLSYEFDVAEAIGTTATLLDLDLERVTSLRPAPTGWSGAAVDWLARDNVDPMPAQGGSRRVGLSDVAALRSMTAAFYQMDDQFGGEYGRQAVAQFIRSDVTPLLSGRFTEAAGRQLFSAAAEVVHLLAWMSYDAGAHGFAQRYFVRALRLAQAGDDLPLAAAALDAMSHQANFVGEPAEAVRLARAARAGTRGVATATLTGHFHAMEARALASLGQRRAAENALAQATNSLERARPADDPSWIQYFNEAELSAELGHCYRDLGFGRQAVDAAAKAMTGSPRADFFVTMVEADGHVMNGDLERAWELTRTALAAGAGMRSARCVDYVRGFRGRLESAGVSAGQLRRFGDQMSANHLWLASSAA